MTFDMSGWLDDDAWKITGVASDKHPQGDVTYAIPSPSIRTTALLRRLEKAFLASQGLVTPEVAPDLQEYLGVEDIEKVDDVDEAMTRRLLGPVYDQMVEDGVSSDRLGRVYQAAVLRFTASEEVVRRMIEFEGKALALQAEMEQANRATRRAATKAAKKAPAKRAPRKAAAKKAPARKAPARKVAAAS